MPLPRGYNEATRTSIGALPFCVFSEVHSPCLPCHPKESAQQLKRISHNLLPCRFAANVSVDRKLLRRPFIYLVRDLNGISAAIANLLLSFLGTSLLRGSHI